MLGLWPRHEAGVIHRDIKPSNVMLTNTGIPKLTDFGIAKRLDSPHLTMTGMIIGTPAYLAPEMCDGGSADSASDIYSFGATLYAMLCGRPPFSGDNIHSILNQVVNKPPPDIRTFCSTVEDELSHLVMRCLEKDPLKRPGSMLEVARVLDPYYTDIAFKFTASSMQEMPTVENAKTISISVAGSDDLDKTTRIPRD